MLNVILLLLFLILQILVLCNAGKVESNCGIEFKPNSNSQIIFGTSLTQYEHPWFCDFEVFFDGQEIVGHCSAVLISSEYILTAAHCFDESKLPQHERFKRLQCGSVGNMIDVKALKVIKHSVFADTDMHDMALIKIKEIRYTEYLRPICLISFEKILEGSPVTVVGSGIVVTRFSGEAKKAEITVKSLKVCTEMYGKWARSKENVLCAGKAITGIRAGDSGGPLMAHYQGRYYLIGITTAKKIDFFGGTFRQDQNPVLFSRIAPECDAFIGNNSNVQCLKNAVPLHVTDPESLSCGEVSESRRHQFLANENGNDATLQPWFCKLMDKNRNDFCGGTLISFRHLLTAQSCLENAGVQISEITVKCGIYFQTTSRISKIRKPQNLNNLKNHDFAIVEFRDEINFDGNVGIACLTETDIVKENPEQLSVINQTSIKVFSSNSLNSALQNISKCEPKSNAEIENTVITCTKETVPLKGGPVLSEIGGKWHIVGVISGAVKNDNRIINYTKVSSFCDFIGVRGNLKCSNTAPKMSHLSLSLLLMVLTLINFM